ncbi:Holliday junction resolvase [Candidatus Woesearchaeota archaeon]|nr:Holliday junction resolvase [Candidatus Woesearchaeota archaeon]
MSYKSKGINAERELIHLFWKNEWTAVRVAGSGSQKYPSPDILASNNLRKLAIETKISKSSYRHFSSKEISELKEFSERFGAESWIAIKFNRKGWFFLSLEDLKETEANYSISLDIAERKGLAFSDLIETR